MIDKKSRTGIEISPKYLFTFKVNATLKTVAFNLKDVVSCLFAIPFFHQKQQNQTKFDYIQSDYIDIILSFYLAIVLHLLFL